ncbi:hypothetical protein B1790_04420 [Mycobacterium sp. AT1]|nr:hypothetical protein B1790_04420 [Mycobacterium sp. AT1]
MRCGDTCELAETYVRGDLDDLLGERVRVHLQDCERCNTYTARLEHVLIAVDAVRLKRLPRHLPAIPANEVIDGLPSATLQER